jgi:FkbM family methyltransferase
MDTQKNIVLPPGKTWQQNILNNIVRRREFPGRLRIINILRKFWNIHLLKRTTPSGLKLLLDLTDWVQSQIYFFGNYEAKSVALFKKLSASADVIFDIGAHIGQYALECAQVDAGMTKIIFAIEVNPKTFTYLLNNIQLNQFTNIKAVLGAVTSKPGVVNINIPAYWNMGNTQVNQAMEDHGFDNFLASSFDVGYLLDKYQINKIDLVKIDVEGLEAEIMKCVFDKGFYPTNVIFEYIPETFSASASLIGLFEKNGYLIKDIEGNIFQGQKNIPEQNLWAQRL